MVTEPYSMVRSLRAAPGRGKALGYAVAFRFEVSLDDVPTGDWSTCAGLKVDFKPEPLRSGGRYTVSEWLPGEATYPRIVLRRAIDANGSGKVQDWLRTQAWKWMRQAYDAKGGTAKIVLYDADDDPVVQWDLRGVHPAAWSGPDLDAAAGKVAQESLELVHAGFQVHVIKGVAQPVNKPETNPEESLQLLELSAKGMTVAFLHNPDLVSVRYSPQGSSEMRQGSDASAALESHDTPAGLSYTGSGLQLIEVPPSRGQLGGHRKLTGTVESAVRLLEWAQPEKASAGTRHVKVTVNWGKFFKNEAMRIQNVQIDYTRFLATGKPIRAKVRTLTLVPWPLEGKKRSANPSSVGLAGRRTHRLIQGESLASVAQKAYGRGTRWRAIAEANGIDDPARVRPGTLLYLPAPAELTDQSSG